jgi:hypothetical protein
MKKLLLTSPYRAGLLSHVAGHETLQQAQLSPDIGDLGVEAAACRANGTKRSKAPPPNFARQFKALRAEMAFQGLQPP